MRGWDTLQRGLVGMSWQSVVIIFSALLAGAFLADQALSLRFIFPPESAARLFFFNFWTELAAIVCPLPALYAYFHGLKAWSKAEKIFFALLALVPLINLTLFVAAVVRFASND